MTIDTARAVITYAGNGATITWGYNFRIPFQADGATPAVLVVVTDADGVNTTLDSAQYTISGVDDNAGGTVTYPPLGSPIPVGSKITIMRDLRYLQPVSVPNQSFFPETVEIAADDLAMLLGQLKARLDRTILMPVPDTGQVLDGSAARASTAWTFDSNGVFRLLSLEDIGGGGGDVPESLLNLWTTNQFGQNCFQVNPDFDQGDTPYPDGLNIGGYNQANFRFQYKTPTYGDQSFYQIYLSHIMARDPLSPPPTKKNENGAIKIGLKQYFTDDTYPQSATALFITTETAGGEMFGKAEAGVIFARHEDLRGVADTAGVGNLRLHVESGWPGTLGNGQTFLIAPPSGIGNIAFVGSPAKNVVVTPAAGATIADLIAQIEADPTANRLFNLSTKGDGTGVIPVDGYPLLTLTGGLACDGKLVAVQTGVENHGVYAGYGNDPTDDDEQTAGPWFQYNNACNATRPGTTSIFAGFGVKSGKDHIYTTDDNAPFTNALYVQKKAIDAYFIHHDSTSAITAPNFPPYYPPPPELGPSTPPTQNPYSCWCIGTDLIDNTTSLVASWALLDAMHYCRHDTTMQWVVENTHAVSNGVALIIDRKRFRAQNSGTVSTAQVNFCVERTIAVDPHLGAEITRREWDFLTAGGVVTHSLGSAGLAISTTGGIAANGKLQGTAMAAVKAAITALAVPGDISANAKTALLLAFA